jgi:hypothetical protein
MFESIFNYIFILIPIAIFVGRVVVQAKNKRSPPPPPKRIPVHFEDDEDEYPAKPKVPPKAVQPKGIFSKEIFPKEFYESLKRESFPKETIPGESFPAESFPKEDVPKDNFSLDNYRRDSFPLESYPPAPALSISAARQPSASQKRETPKAGGLNLGHLSPLKQAVVMAEILGTPKALQ